MMYMAFPRDSFIIQISMYFGATSEVACSDGRGNRVFYIGGSAGRAPWDTRLQSPSLRCDLG